MDLPSWTRGHAVLSWNPCPASNWLGRLGRVSASELHGFFCPERAQTDFFLLSQSHRVQPSEPTLHVLGGWSRLGNHEEGLGALQRLSVQHKSMWGPEPRCDLSCINKVTVDKVSAWWSCSASGWSSALGSNSRTGGVWFFSSFLIRHWLYTVKWASLRSTAHWNFPYPYTYANTTQMEIQTTSSSTEGFLIPIPIHHPQR